MSQGIVLVRIEDPYYCDFIARTVGDSRVLRAQTFEQFGNHLGEGYKEPVPEHYFPGHIDHNGVSLAVYHLARQHGMPEFSMGRDGYCFRGNVKSFFPTIKVPTIVLVDNLDENLGAAIRRELQVAHVVQMDYHPRRLERMIKEITH